VVTEISEDMEKVIIKCFRGFQGDNSNALRRQEIRAFVDRAANYLDKEKSSELQVDCIFKGLSNICNGKISLGGF
jgi:hypothetical protein